MFAAVFVYTTVRIYPLSINDTSDIFSDKGVINRIFSKFGLIFSIGAILILCLAIFRPFIEKVINFLWKKSGREKRVERRKIPFTAIKERMKKNSLVTYNIWKDPRYSHILNQAKRDINICLLYTSDAADE
eukprot:TRINITY_DN2006_c0_g6_i1.p3 TRINITY_DN2006_c0_g6~~TRINITY_DN2006_c0_g6_i1.p3  ORF type:complete len:131 (+),score=21.81 TRINITY_DN2006_c0_g6_i1:936-1328(+)